MTPSEFKAWFDGFTEAFAGCPTKAQWTRIKARVDEIDGKSVTERVYVDRYLPSYPSYPYWRYANGFGVSNNLSCVGMSASNLSPAQDYQEAASRSNQVGGGGVAFNSAQAMCDLGRAEALSLNS